MKNVLNHFLRAVAQALSIDDNHRINDDNGRKITRNTNMNINVKNYFRNKKLKERKKRKMTKLMKKHQRNLR